MSGILYLCATPIGNLEDMTLRVLNVLKSCDVIAAEDTRHTLKLLNHFEISAALVSYHEHNKKVKGPQLLNLLLEGKNIALVTDAGMPGISDPGEDMVRLCHENGVKVTACPGAVALTTALVLSGLPTRRFVFEGFLPVEKRERREALKRLSQEVRTSIFYEAPHHLLQTLEELYEAAGDRNAACCRELTKKFEEIKKGTLSQLIAFYKENPPKGEFAVIIEGKSHEEKRQEEIAAWEALTVTEHMERYLLEGMSEKDAMKAVAKDRGLSKRDIYALVKK